MFLDLGQDLRERFQFLVCLGRMAGSLPAFSDQDSEEQSDHNDRPQIPSPALPFLFHSDSFLSLCPHRRPASQASRSTRSAPSRNSKHIGLPPLIPVSPVSP